MARVTLQVIEGLERGRVYADLDPPISIGREDDNVIRLNDERVSRFHAKIQEDGGRIILTDLDSTNGTRVNGHPVQMRVLQIGDQLSIGRCLLIFGSREQIARRYAESRSREASGTEGSQHTVEVSSDIWESSDQLNDPVALEESYQFSDETREAHSLLFPKGPPDPPENMEPGKRAQVSDVLAYFHEQIRLILQSACEEPTNEAQGLRVMRVAWPAWQRLLSLEMDLAVYLRKIAEPED